MTINTLVKNIIGVNRCLVKSVDKEEMDDGTKKLIVTVEPYKSDQCRCPLCKNGKKLPRYDSSKNMCTWRALDCGGVIVELKSNRPRVTCPVHNVISADVPWAFPNSKFTKDFDLTVAWMAKALCKSAVSEFMRISWMTVGRCVTRAREFLEPDIQNRLQGLRQIGIDETSYSKGHKYITTVVNHETNTVVWVSDGHGKTVLTRFFEELTEEQRAAIEVVSGDGAKWITECVNEYCPQAKRCTDPFHVVEWANEALDEIRKESWRDANKELKEVQKETKLGKGRPSKDDEDAKKLAKAKEKAKNIKSCKYPLGKAPENLTENQQVKLSQIKSRDPRLYRAYELKEALRNILKIKDRAEAEVALKQWISWARRSRIEPFKELGAKIKRHEEYILNFIETGISNARVEANNNKISLLVHRSFGFRNFNNMVDLILLVCSNISIPLPNRPVQ